MSPRRTPAKPAPSTSSPLRQNAAASTQSKAPARKAITPRRKKPAPGDRPTVDLALQGGGSHGAFTWGVLDRLLDDDGLNFMGISGTSAGALNGAVMLSAYVQGHAEGGEAEARRRAQQGLRDFWQDVSRHGPIFSPLTIQNGMLRPEFNFDQFPAYQWLNMFTRAFSPYEFNPLNLNPLRDVLQRHVKVEALHQGCQDCGVHLFITATSVRTGQARVFTDQALSVDALLASACLPFVFQAVEIDGEPYWDGGYTGNPALFPLIYNTQAMDILLVKINALMRHDTPTRSMDIIDRLSEITFNTSLIGEMRAIAFVSRLLKEQKLDPGRYKDLRLHMVADDDGLMPYNASSKFNTDWAFLQQLHALGRQAAEGWLAAHRADVGHRSSLQIEDTFLSSAGLSTHP
ncbi:patatin-like phospholipase family protein [Aquabacterium soli]|uniref:Patatin-like phospholipase family protein n=1 Tax=Aquabacterium soli TaxID=2493092 RepID=A0A426V8W1_9BURK|nr:patatin-like phospholipase family protein [Aquabacterium soli]RRS03271.1 patatin-like phospholipase family protein [Aquabacterium soli]